jgi:hypothetical protein
MRRVFLPGDPCNFPLWKMFHLPEVGSHICVKEMARDRLKDGMKEQTGDAGISDSGPVPQNPFTIMSGPIMTSGTMSFGSGNRVKG